MTEPTAPDASSDPVALLHAAMAEERTLTLVDIADAVGMSVAEAGRIMRASGRDRRDHYGSRDVAYLERVAELARTLPFDAIERHTRVRTRAVHGVATASLAGAQEHVAAPMARAGASGDEIVDRLRQMLTGVMPVIGELLVADYTESLENLLASDAVSAAHRAGGTQVDLSICFVDIVGYTKLSASIDAAGLDAVLDEFERHVHDVADDTDVLVTKYIGDAAMLVSEHPAAITETALRLVTSPEARRARAGRRAGVTTGTVIAREGDYVGPAVNLAARLTDLARPGTVLAGPEFGEDDPSVLDLVDRSHLEAVDIKGVGHVRPWRLRPRDP